MLKKNWNDNMECRIKIAKSAFNRLKQLPEDIKTRLIKTINGLSTDPRPDNCVPIKGKKNAYRIRKGNYRIIYTINDDYLLILIIRIGHRKDIYRNV